MKGILPENRSFAGVLYDAEIADVALFLAICILQGCSFTREISPSPTKEILQPAGHQRSRVSEAVEPAVPSSDMGSIPFREASTGTGAFFLLSRGDAVRDRLRDERAGPVVDPSIYRTPSHALPEHPGQVRLLCPVMEQIFESYGLPKDLVYLSMVESGGVATAVSRTGATGYWQFMTSTAIHYDLKVGRWIDERRDLEKSTMRRPGTSRTSTPTSGTGSWQRGIQCGRGHRQQDHEEPFGVSSFWDISRPMPIKTETLEYIPKFIATLVLAKNRSL